MNQQDREKLAYIQGGLEMLNSIMVNHPEISDELGKYSFAIKRMLKKEGDSDDETT